jgi:hypothetical protein
VRNAYKICSINLKGRDQSEDLDVDRKIILEWMWALLNTVNEPSGSINGAEFLD